jgi:hypothetical protein
VEHKWTKSKRVLEEVNRGRISKSRQNMGGINLKYWQRKGADRGTFVIINDTYY